MNVTQISIGRFHHFHLARQMEKHGLLDAIWTGYPMFKLKEEQGIPRNKIRTFPWIHTPYMKRAVLGLDKSNWLTREWEWLNKQMLDRHVTKNIVDPTILIALSGSGLGAGKRAQQLGGIHICDRGSTHIRAQNETLSHEYERWGLKFTGIDPRILEKEEKEYEQSDLITVPSEFVRQTFIERGIAESKIIKIPYGARLERFKKLSEPDEGIFRVLWVGNISIRKGFMYALEAFNEFNHPNKEFVVIGSMTAEIKGLIQKKNLGKVNFMGTVPNIDLPKFYSSSQVFILPSIEEGLAMVQGEALACGCPIITTKNTGCEELIIDNQEGFVVEARSSEAILQRLHNIADDPNIRERMSAAAIKRVKSLGGWDTYGDTFKKVLSSMSTDL